MLCSIKTGSTLDISIWTTFKIPAWLTDIIFDLITHFWKKLRSFLGYKVIMVQYLLTNIDNVCIQTNPFYPLHKGIENYRLRIIIDKYIVLKFSNSPCERKCFYTLFQTRNMLFSKGFLSIKVDGFFPVFSGDILKLFYKWKGVCSK